MGGNQMTDLDRDALDRHITGGRYSATSLLVTCKSCDVITEVLAETDYGFTSWTPAECNGCGRGFDPDEEDSEYTWETAE